MSAAIKGQNGLNSSSRTGGKPLTANAPEASTTDSQVKIKKHSPRRTYTTAYKLQILAAFNACESSAERGALLRQEGLYHSRICAWKLQLEKAKLKGKGKAGNSIRTERLILENEQLKKKLAHAEAIIDIQKKISELLGTHILPVEKNA